MLSFFEVKNDSLMVEAGKVINKKEAIKRLVVKNVGLDIVRNRSWSMGKARTETDRCPRRIRDKGIEKSIK